MQTTVGARSALDVEVRTRSVQERTVRLEIIFGDFTVMTELTECSRSSDQVAAAEMKVEVESKSRATSKTTPRFFPVIWGGRHSELAGPNVLERMRGILVDM